MLSVISLCLFAQGLGPFASVARQSPNPSPPLFTSVHRLLGRCTNAVMTSGSSSKSAPERVIPPLNNETLNEIEQVMPMPDWTNCGWFAERGWLEDHV